MPNMLVAAVLLAGCPSSMKGPDGAIDAAPINGGVVDAARSAADSTRREIRALAMELVSSVRAKNARQLLELLTRGPVFCGDRWMERHEVENDLANVKSPLFAWMFDETAAWVGTDNRKIRSVAFDVRSDQLVSLEVGQDAQGAWVISIRGKTGRHDMRVARFGAEGRWLVISGLSCVPDGSSSH